MKKWVLIIITVIWFGFLQGCQESNLVIEENKQLTDTNVELRRQISELSSQNLQLKSQIATLSGTDPNVNIENIISVAKIKIADRTGFFDKDYNGVKETFICYVKTYDQFGDAIKGAGSVDIEVWDLSLPEEQAKLASWSISPEELKNEWASAMMTNYYRLVFDISNIEKVEFRNITLKVRFTDYLTGKVFEEQVVIDGIPSPVTYNDNNSPLLKK